MFLFKDIEVKYAHFIGIGGISMSGLAEILMHHGVKISGSDLKESVLTQNLEKKGANIFYSHNSTNITNPDIVVYTAAINPENEELKRAAELGIPQVDRSVLLGTIMKKYKRPVAVSGTHGKTTTTSILSTILLEQDSKPTIHIGGVLNSIGGNTYIGNSDVFISEACEYVESFLNFSPFISVILNIEEDHLDFYQGLSHIKSSFEKFANQTLEGGYIVANLNDENTMDVISNLDSNIITFGINNKKADFNAKDITFDKNGHASYDVYRNKKKLGRVNMSIPGIHNVSNALSAIAVCDLLGCSFKTITAGIQKFTGTKRRFEIKGIKNGVTVVDDYAHHPSEIIQTLNAAKKITKNNLWCIFQPHTYTRTIALFDEFQKAFDLADHVIVTDIYAAREKDTGKINSKQLAKGISLYHNDVRYLKSFNEISSYVASNAHDGDIIITMGAGSITELGNIILSNLCTSVP